MLSRDFVSISAIGHTGTYCSNIKLNRKILTQNPSYMIVSFYSMIYHKLIFSVHWLMKSCLSHQKPRQISNQC